MDWMSRTDVILLGIAAYVAVMTLVRLMKRRRDQLVADVQRQVDAQRKRPKPAASTAKNDRGAA
jgi:hypothetical protein